MHSARKCGSQPMFAQCQRFITCKCRLEIAINLRILSRVKSLLVG